MAGQAEWEAVRARIGALQSHAATRASLPFGDDRLDRRLPGGGLPLGRWHAVGGAGMEGETAVLAAAFVAAVATPLARRGAVVWVARRDDLHAPGLAGLGFPAADLIQVRVRDEAQALAALDDALSAAGVAAAVGEVEDVDLTAGRRLQLACERRGATGFVIRRRLFGLRAARPVPGAAFVGAGGSVEATRWRVEAAPSEPAAGSPGLGPPRWRVTLERCRGGRPGAWLMEKTDGPHPLRVVAEMGDRQLEAPQPLRRAG